MISVQSILLLCSLVEVINTQTYENTINLRSALLTASYDADVLPLDDQSGTLNMNLTAYVFMISEVNQVEGSVTMGVMITQEWFDERLSWTPGNHGGLTTVSIKSKDVWTPSLTVANPVEFIMLDQSWMPVMYMYNGKAMYTVGEVVKFTCSFYMKFWPFDKQVCSLHLFVYGYTSEQLSLAVPGTVINTDYYSKNGEWRLDQNSFEYRIENFFGASKVKYSFRLERLPAFYLLTVILPLNGIGALTCLVFLLPSEAGERVGYSITILLALAVFLTVASEELPKNSEPIPMFCLYTLFDMIVCILALIFIIISLRLYHRNEDIPIPRYYKSIVRYSKFKFRRNEIQDGDDRSTSSLENTKTSLEKQEKQASVRKIFVASRNSVPVHSEAVQDEKEEITWKTVSEAVDKIVFFAMVILTYIPSIIIVIYMSAGSEYVEQ